MKAIPGQELGRLIAPPKRIADPRRTVAELRALPRSEREGAWLGL